MEPITTGALVAGAASLLGSGTNAVVQGKLNKKTRQWNEKMYALQRSHNLQDWNTQNAYNSPVAQMDRLREAGLNPKLLYGNGSAATGEAQAVGKADMKSWSPDPINIDFSSAIGAFQDYQMKKVQTSNLEKTGDLLTLDAILKTKDSTAKDLANANSKIDVERNSRLLETQVELAQQQLLKLTADTNKTLQDIDIAQVMKEPNLQQALQNIAQQKLTQAKTEAETNNIRATLQNIKQDTRLKKADADLREKGIYPGDPLWLRALIQNIEGWFGNETSPSKIINGLGQVIPRQSREKSVLDSTGRVKHGKPHPSKTWKK